MTLVPVYDETIQEHVSFIITKLSKNITEDGRDKVLFSKPDHLNHKFRLLDDDNIVYAYGYSSSPHSFAPLDQYRSTHGCTNIQYFENYKWQSL